jgi:hypothetical protein
MKLLNPVLEARSRALVEARLTSDEAKAAEAKLAAQRIAFAKGKAETEELHDLWSKDLKGAQAELEKIIGDIARFDLLPEESDEGRELFEALENLVVAFSAAMRVAHARAAGDVAALDRRADEVSLHLANSRGHGAPAPATRNSQGAVFSRLEQRLLGVVAKAAEGNEPSSDHAAFLGNVIRKGLGNAIDAARRASLIRAADEAKRRNLTGVRR